MLDFSEKHFAVGGFSLGGIVIQFDDCKRCLDENSLESRVHRTIVLAALLKIAAKLKARIIHRFLEKGHTQNEGDSVHARIERFTRNDEIFVPAEWYEKIRQAKRSKTNPYRTYEVSQEAFLDFEELANKLNFLKEVTGEPFKVSQVRETKFDGDKPGVLQFKYSFDEEYRTLSTNKQGHPVNLVTYELRPTYSGPLGCPKERIADLKELCAKQIIPRKYHDFYNSLVPEISPENNDAADPGAAAVQNRGWKRKAPDSDPPASTPGRRRRTK